MDGPELEPLQEERHDDAPRPPAWPYGLLIFLVGPVLVIALGNAFPRAGCALVAGVYLAQLIGGVTLREGSHDRLGRALLFSVVATCAAVALAVLIGGGVCLVMSQ